MRSNAQPSKCRWDTLRFGSWVTAQLNVIGRTGFLALGGGRSGNRCGCQQEPGLSGFIVLVIRAGYAREVLDAALAER